MKIGLLDIDNYGKKIKFPNLALMKLSAHHKKQGDQVEIYDSMAFMEPYDKVYMSKIFDYSKEPDFNIYSEEISRGGVAYSLDNKLPYEVEHMMPDYDLYGFKDTAYGFITRGCPRNCSFCNVTQNQGNKALKVSELSEFWNGQKNIVLLDPNVLACKDYESIFQDLIDSRSYIDFSQGLDIRLMTEEKALMIKKMRIKMIHFAWDFMKFEKQIVPKLKMFKEVTEFNKSKMRVYVLVNYDTTHDEDLYRIYTLREMGYDPYIMIYDKFKLPKGHKTLRMARWVNNIIIWRKCERFEDYNG